MSFTRYGKHVAFSILRQILAHASIHRAQGGLINENRQNAETNVEAKCVRRRTNETIMDQFAICHNFQLSLWADRAKKSSSLFANILFVLVVYSPLLFHDDEFSSISHLNLFVLFVVIFVAVQSEGLFFANNSEHNYKVN